VQVRELVILDTIGLKDFMTMLDGALELTHEMEIETLLRRDHLDLATLNELERNGYIGKASDIASWLNPDIHWIAPTEYGDAFEQELADQKHAAQMMDLDPEWRPAGT
jgi:hypothetical protein